MANKNLIAERLKALNENKDKLKQEKPTNVVNDIVAGKEEKPDFNKMSAVLNSQNDNADKDGANAGYIKDTIYIREDLYNAMQALSTERGQKKKNINAAYELYLTKVYKELGIDMTDIES